MQRTSETVRNEPALAAETILPNLSGDGDITGPASVVEEAGTPTTPGSRLKLTAA